MNRLSLLRSSLLVGILASTAGAFLLIMHQLGAHAVLAVGVLASLIFLGTALVDILTSRRATGGEKALWILLLLGSGTVGGIFYLLIGRRYVAAGQGL